MVARIAFRRSAPWSICAQRPIPMARADQVLLLGHPAQELPGSSHETSIRGVCRILSETRIRSSSSWPRHLFRGPPVQVGAGRLAG